MGQQQLILLILAVVIIGIAVTIGLSMFIAQSLNSASDAILAEMTDIAAGAYQYKIRHAILGGGNGSYVGYSIPLTLQSNENASYVLTSTAPAQISITATSSQGYGTISATFGSNGKMLGPPTYTGQF